MAKNCYKFSLLIAFGTVFFAVTFENCTASDDDICETRGCQEAADYFLLDMDFNSDPCDNFYQYACGNYKLEKSDPYEWSLTAQEVKIENKMIALLEKSYQTDDPKYFKVLKDYYTSCINLDKRNALGSKPLMSLVQELGGFPVIEGSLWNEKSFNFKNFVLQICDSGLQNWIFNIDVRSPEQDLSKNLIYVSVRSLINKDVVYDNLCYNKTSMESCPLFQLAVNVSVLLGADKNEAEKEFLDVFQFALEIANNYSLEKVEGTEPDIVMTLDEFQKLFPDIDWLELLNKLNFEKTITGDEEIIVENPSSFTKLSTLLSTSKPKTIANYLVFQAVANTFNFLDEKFEKLYSEFLGKPVKALVNRPRNEKCLDYVNEYFFPNTMELMLLRSNSRSISMAEEIFKSIKSELLEEIENLKWFEGEVIEKAKNKVQDLNFDNDLSFYDNFFNKMYEKYSIKDDEYFNNNRNLVKHDQDFIYTLLTKSQEEMEQIDYFLYQYEADESYNAKNNTIRINKSILMDDRFNADWPDYLKYATIGTIIGSEIIHSIDYKGRDDWWNEGTNKKFREIINCIEKQYNSLEFSKSSEKIDFPIIKDEEFGNILGAIIAYKAYVKREKLNGRESQLPGLNLNGRQLFWLNMAKMQCSMEKQENSFRHIENFNDPALRFKIFGAIINSANFGADFNCSSDTKMNPTEKCEFYSI